MAIFTNPKTVTASSITESFDEVTASAIEEGVEYSGLDLDEMAMSHVAESEENFNKIMMAIGIHEASVYAESGEEVVYTEGTLSDIKDKIVSFIKAVWNKIVSIFKRFIAMFDAWNKDDKAFLDKYKGELVKRAGKLKDFKFSGYTFTKLDKGSEGIKKCEDIAKVAKEYDNEITDKDEEDFDETIEQKRGEVLAAMSGSTGSYTASEFSKELFELFRNGESNKSELDKIDLTSIMSDLAGSKEARKQAKSAYDNAKKVCDGFIKEVEALDKTAVKNIKGNDSTSDETNVKASRKYNHAIRMIRAALSIMQVVNGAHLTALKDKSRQNKAICVKIMSSVKAEAAGSWEYEIEEGASFLAGVKFN